MSEREQLCNRIASHCGKGAVTGMEDLAKGKVRTVRFGDDNVVSIFGAKFLVFKSPTHGEVKYTSEATLCAWLDKEFGE